MIKAKMKIDIMGTFEDLAIGDSVSIPITDIKESTLRAYAYRFNAKNENKISVNADKTNLSCTITKK